MQDQFFNPWRFALLLSAGASIAILGLASAAALQPAQTQISQKGRAFRPGEINIHKNAPLEILNDDGDLLHHAFVESDQFNFDSGDQEPGSKVQIVFPVIGTFDVLCGIHPKMKLIVHVD